MPHYHSKNWNQFFDCTNVTGIIQDAEDVGINTYCYAASNTGDGSVVKVRLNSVLEDFAFGTNNKYDSHGDVAMIKTLGINW